ncbi:MAG TPA: hypothetical protein VL949_00235 [Geobacteraceae bacterium]|jgi:hypothetical protein|nr:hypothetical protein [Geobacteraceae bacterium]
MKKLIFVAALVLCTPLTGNAAMSQADCPQDTIWNSSTNQCYPDPNSPTAKREQEQQRREAERLKEEERRKQEMENKAQEEERRRRSGSDANTPNPSQPLMINR